MRGATPNVVYKVPRIRFCLDLTPLRTESSSVAAEKIVASPSLRVEPRGVTVWIPHPVASLDSSPPTHHTRCIACRRSVARSPTDETCRILAAQKNYAMPDSPRTNPAESVSPSPVSTVISPAALTSMMQELPSPMSPLSIFSARLSSRRRITARRRGRAP